MTLLAIDAGNTRVKWGVHDGREWLHRGVLPSAECGQVGAALGAWPVTRAIIANVAGERIKETLRAALGEAIAQHWVVSASEQCGVRSSYAQPAQLGPDRWAALIGARHFHEGACVVVNAGTTLTVDALTSESIFLGGIIVAGHDLMRNTLAANTAHLALRDGEFHFFPDNTGDAIASGAVNALAGAVERMCRYMIETGEDEPLVMLSGGNAALLAPHVGSRLQLVDNLVLEGLAKMGAEIGNS
jgi:type III pantothenate kinase